MDINFHMPTKVIMAKECILSNSSIFKSLGTKALIVTGAHSAKANGSLNDVIAALKKECISYSVYDKVMSNPTIACVYDGAKTAKSEKVDFIIAIGGGSPMDAAKAIALLSAQDISEDDLFSGKYESKVLPMAFVPTTAGTGSEVTPYSILTNDKAQTKTSIASPLLFPTIAFLDSKYTINLSLTTTINTAIDALSHAVEGMLSVRSNAMTDMIAVQSIKLISECFDALKNNTLTDEVREKLLYASMLSGIVITHTGTTAVHSMGYSLTYFKNIDHGRANGLLIVEFLNYVYNKKPEKIDQILSAMNLISVNEFKSVINGLLGTKEKITAEELKKYASIAIKAKNIPNCIVTPNESDLFDIYNVSFSV